MTSASRKLSPEAARTSRERRVPSEPQPLLGDVKELPSLSRPGSTAPAPEQIRRFGDLLKVGKSILVINLAPVLAALGNQAGYPLKSLLPRPARNNGSSTTMACTTP